MNNASGVSNTSHWLEASLNTNELNVTENASIQANVFDGSHSVENTTFSQDRDYRNEIGKIQKKAASLNQKYNEAIQTANTKTALVNQKQGEVNDLSFWDLHKINQVK